MSTQIRPAPVRKTIRVEAPPARAFEVFTGGIGIWWPKSHKIGQADLAKPVIEPRAGGRWYQVNVDASECDVGKVLEWDPPRRLLLAWQLNAEFKFDPDLITEVELLFVPDGSGTRVDLEHRYLERLGETGPALREAIDSPNGWGLLLQLYAETAKQGDSR